MATRTGIRQFDTRDTYPLRKLDNGLCQAVITRGGKNSLGVLIDAAGTEAQELQLGAHAQSTLGPHEAPF